jgi:hypothetical protein
MWLVVFQKCSSESAAPALIRPMCYVVVIEPRWMLRVLMAVIASKWTLIHESLALRHTHKQLRKAEDDGFAPFTAS